MQLNATKKPDLSKFDAFLFDMDGTLVNSMWLWKQIDIDYLGRFNIPLPPHLQEDIEGKSFSETAIYFKERFQISDSIEKMKADWNNMAFEMYSHHVPLKPGIIEFLEYCKKNNKKTAVATSTSRELQTAVFTAHDIHKYFDVIITSNDIHVGKPAPDIYLKAAEKINVSPSKCLVFEDLTLGLQAGISAGMKVCAVEDEYSADKREEKISMADYYINNYFELLSCNKN